jgi:hypothetical protein
VQQELLPRQSSDDHPSKRSRRSHAERLALLQHWILPAALHPRGFLGRCRHGPWPGGCLLRCWRASRSGWPGSGPQSVRRGRGGAPRVVVPSIISRRPHRSRHRRGPATRHPIAPLRSGAGTSPYRVPVAEFARQIARPGPRACDPQDPIKNPALISRAASRRADLPTKKARKRLLLIVIRPGTKTDLRYRVQSRIRRFASRKSPKYRFVYASKCRLRAIQLESSPVQELT